MAAQAFPLGQRPNPISSTGEQLTPEQELMAALPPNIMQRFIAENQQLPPDELQAKLIMMATDYAKQAEMGGGQMRRGGSITGNAIRNAPEGRTTRNGIYTASNPLEFVGNLAQQHAGNKMYEKGLGEQRGAQASEAQLRADAIRRMTLGQ